MALWAGGSTGDGHHVPPHLPRKSGYISTSHQSALGRILLVIFMEVTASSGWQVPACKWRKLLGVSPDGNEFFIQDKGIVI